MKRLTTIFTFLWLAIAAIWAQELTIKEMKVSPTDLTASTMPRMDRNGNPCGLIKVQLAAIGAQFEGNVIQPTDYKTGEYWVYMTEGSYMLRIKHPNFVPLSINFRDYGIRGIEPKTVYELTLLMPQIGQEIDDGMRYLVMNVEPKNCTVYIDDKLQNVQNGSVSLRLSQGSHTYRVEAFGYAPETGQVVLGNSKSVKEITLRSVLASLNVTCPTQGAEIYVNDELKGTVPWNGQLAAGTYKVEARLQSHRSQQQNVTLADSENRTLSIPALTPITSSMDVNYQPVECEIWLDGQKLGTSPDIFRGILVGKHQMEIRKNGYESKTVTVNVEEGKTASIIGSLKESKKTVVSTPTTQNNSYSNNNNNSYSNNNNNSYSNNNNNSYSSGSVGGSVGTFFPIYGITLGQSTVQQSRNMGYNVKEYNGTNFWDERGIGIWDHDKDGIWEWANIDHYDTMPDEWIRMGLTWDISYNEAKNLMQRLGFNVNVTKSPSVVTWDGRKVLDAEFTAKHPDGQLDVEFDFNYGYGSSVSASKTLYQIYLIYRGTPGRIASSTPAVSSSYSSNTSSSGDMTIGQLISHPLSCYSTNVRDKSRKDIYNEVKRLHPDWTLENSSDNDWVVARNMTGVSYRGHKIGSAYFASSIFNYFFDDSGIMADAKRDLEALGFYESNKSSNSITMKHPNTDLYVVLEDNYFYVSIPSSAVSFDNANSYSSNSSYSTSSNYSSSAGDMSIAELISHPLTCIASNAKGQNRNSVYNEIKRQHPDWTLENSSDSKWVVARNMTGVSYRGRKIESAYFTEWIYNYFFDNSSANIMSDAQRDLEALGFYVSEKSSDKVIMKHPNTDLDVNLEPHYFYVGIPNQPISFANSSNTSSYSSGSSSFSLPSGELTLEEMIMHPAGCVSSNSKYQGYRDVLNEIKRKQPTWDVEWVSNNNWIVTKIGKTYRGQKIYGGGTYINFENNDTEISFYNYFFENRSGLYNEAVREMKNAGWTMTENKSKSSVFTKSGSNAKKVTLEDNDGYLYVVVWM